jgi:predicted HicB family RNase H-like nuclease
VNELEAAFKKAVDHYIDACARLGDKPNKPCSGKLTLRISPAAEANGKSLNKWIADTLDQVVHAH